jgi:hypothetical protein
VIPPHDQSIWPDDTRRAAVTVALSATIDDDAQFGDVVTTIEEALASGRPLQFVMELIRLLAAGWGEQLKDPHTAAQFRQLAAQCQAAEEEMRSQGRWRA